jgi:putative transposase
LKIAIINITKENPNLRKISASTLARYIKYIEITQIHFMVFIKELVEIEV